MLFGPLMQEVVGGSGLKGQAFHRNVTGSKLAPLRYPGARPLTPTIPVELLRS